VSINKIIKTMAKKCLHTAILFSCFVQLSLAQNIRIDGRIYDDRKEIVHGASVRVFTYPDSLEFSFAPTDAFGYFELFAPTNIPFFLTVSFFGYETLRREFGAENNRSILNMGDLTLNVIFQSLEDVAISGDVRFVQKSAEKLTINVERSVIGSAGNAGEILDRLPGVVVDRQNNSIKVNGKEGVAIMINGKVKKIPQDALLKMLEAINGSNVEKIELINSNAAEDAEGTGGFVNIVTKKNSLPGHQGAYNATLGVGRYEKTALGGEFGYSRDKVFFFGFGSLGWNRAYADFGNDRQLLDQNGAIVGTSNFAERTLKNLVGNLDLSLNYQVLEDTQIGIGAFSSLNRVNIDEVGKTSFFNNSELARFTQIFHDEKNEWTQFGTNINATRTLREDEVVLLSLDYLNYNNHNPHFYVFENHENIEGGIPSLISNSNVSKSTPIKFYVGKADYRRKTNGKYRLNLGIKQTYSSLENDVPVTSSNLSDEWKTDINLSQNIKMHEDISAIYGDFGLLSRLGLDINLGLRYEYTKSKLNNGRGISILDRKFGNLFPSISIQKKNEDKLVGINYNRRITRPTFAYLAPYVHFVDDLTLISGNMELKHFIADNIEGVFQFKERYTATVGYSFSDRPIIPYQTHIDIAANKQIIKAENLKKSNLVSIGLIISYRLTSWWDTYTNLAGLYGSNESLYNGTAVLNEKAYFSLNTTHNFKMLKNVTGEISGMYQSKSPFGMAYLLPFGKVGAGIKINTKNDRGTIRLTMDDLFWNMNFSIDNPQPSLGFNQSFKAVFSEPRVVRLTYTKSFGIGSKKDRRGDSTEEEKKRIGN